MKKLLGQPRRSRQCVRLALWYYCRKKHKSVKIEMAVCTLIDNEYASLLFSQIIFFSHCFRMLSDFAKVFERKVWRVQVAHLHNVARALSSPGRCFHCQQILANISFFRYLWYCEKQIECGLAWHWWNSTDLGLIDMFSINLNAEVVACMFYHSENRATSQIWKILPNMVSPPPDLRGKNGGVLSMRMQVIEQRLKK